MCLLSSSLLFISARIVCPPSPVLVFLMPWIYMLCTVSGSLKFLASREAALLLSIYAVMPIPAVTPQVCAAIVFC